MIIRVPIEITQTGTGLQATVKGLEQVEQKAKAANAAAHGFGSGLQSSTQRAGAFADSVGRVSTTLARSADAFGLPAGALRSLDDVMDVAEIGFGNLTKSAVGFNAASVGIAGAGLAIGTAIGSWLNTFPAVQKVADSLFHSMFRLVGLAGEINKSATAGLGDFRKEKGASNEEALMKQVASMREMGKSTKEISAFYKGTLNPELMKRLGLTEKAVKAEEKVLSAMKKEAEEQQRIQAKFRGDKTKEQWWDQAMSEMKGMNKLMTGGLATSIAEGRRSSVTAQGGDLMGSLMGGGLATSLALSYSQTRDLARLEAAAKVEKEATAEAERWSMALQGVAFMAGAIGGNLGKAMVAAANIGESFKGWKEMTGQQKFGAVAGAVGQIGGVIGGRAGGAISGAAGGAMAGMAFGGQVGAVAGGIIGGVAGLFGAGKRQREELKQMKAQFIDTFGGMDALKAKAKEAGVSLEKLFSAKDKKGLERAIKDVTAGVEKFERKMAGLKEARSAAESLMGRMGEGGFSEKLTASFGTLIGKVQDALLKSGLGFMATGPLRESKAFGAAQGAAGDVAQLIAGMREAGMIDTGLMQAAGASAEELRAQAVAAAEAAGLAPAEATKAGFGAIAPLLREQLNAAMASGQELDANTKALIEEAKKNGVTILADPMVESVAVQKDILKELRNSNTFMGRRMPDEEFASGTRGLRLVRRNMLAQIHAGEGMLVIPRDEMRGMAFRSFAKGTDGDDGIFVPRDQRDPIISSGITTTSTTTSSADTVAAVEAAVTKVVSQIQPISVTNAPTVQIVDNSIVRTVEGQKRFERDTVAAVERALDQNARGLESRIERIARRVVQ